METFPGHEDSLEEEMATHSSILKSLLYLFQYCFCFIYFIFLITHEVCGFLASCPGIEPVSPALEGKVSTTGLSEKSLEEQFYKRNQIRNRTK